MSPRKPLVVGSTSRTHEIDDGDELLVPAVRFLANGSGVSFGAQVDAGSGRMELAANAIDGPHAPAMTLGPDDVAIPVLTSTTQSPGDNSTKVATTAYVDAAVAGGAPRLVIPLFSGNASTKFGSAQKLVLGSQYFDPSDPAHGLGGSSTATLCMLLESTSGSVNAQGELFQKSGTGSPQVIAATSTTAATTATLVTADVSAAFTDTSPAGIFCARLWTGTPNGVNQATCTGAWIEVTA